MNIVIAEAETKRQQIEELTQQMSEMLGTQRCKISIVILQINTYRLNL